MSPVGCEIWREGHFHAAVPVFASLRRQPPPSARSGAPSPASLRCHGSLPAVGRHRGCHPRATPVGRSRCRPCRARRCSRLRRATPQAAGQRRRLGRHSRSPRQEGTRSARPRRHQCESGRTYADEEGEVFGCETQEAHRKTYTANTSPISPARTDPMMPTNVAVVAAPEVFDEMGARYDASISCSSFTFLHCACS